MRNRLFLTTFILVLCLYGTARAQDHQPVVAEPKDEEVIAVLEILELMEMLDDMDLYKDMEYLTNGGPNEHRD